VSVREDRMSPDPNLVVEALRGHLIPNGMVCTKCKTALPHAQAIAEMWDENVTIGVGFFKREPAVQELIAAARAVSDEYRREYGTLFDFGKVERLRDALNAFEETA
jgi:hypothetical protein